MTFDPRVAVAKLPAARYADGLVDHEIGSALERVARNLGWSDDERGPFGKVIAPGVRVLIKPNFVLHENQGAWGLEPLVTHQTLVRATVEAALQAGASEVLVGDAPLQGCDFQRLLSATELDAWSRGLMQLEPRFKGISDFRRTTCVFVDGVRVAEENVRKEDNFVLFDLGESSLLEPISDERGAFRVTCYDPRLLARTHAPGRHQYLVAKDILHADVVIDLPKLKTHMKAGVTCALKNLIGINGNKEYLPHHRLGGAATGGDCYPGGSKVKRALEYAFDQQNMTAYRGIGKLWHAVARQLYRVLRLKGDHLGIEGAWSGNDTIWRTCLDLNRILIYGRTDATMSDEPQRRVIHIVDAVVAGQGNGPLAPQPLPLALLLAGENAAAVDLVSALLLGYRPERIPIVSHALESFRWPLTKFRRGEISLLGDLGAGVADDILKEETAPAVMYPVGWRDAAARVTAESVSPVNVLHALAE